MNKNPHQRDQYQRDDCKDPIETALWKSADIQSNSIEVYKGGCHTCISIDNQESHSSKDTNVDERSITGVIRGLEL